MDHKTRLLGALHRQPVDRVPVFMWFHPNTTEHLAALLEIPAAFVGEAMGNDVQQTWVNNNYAMEGITHPQDGDWHVDEWGIRWVKRYFFNQIEGFPLDQADRDQVLAYRFPDHSLPDLLSRMQPLVEDRRDFFIGCDISPCAFEMYWRLRGMQNAMLDMAADPDLAWTMLGRCADFAITLGEAACQAYDLDWLWTGDDVAWQGGMLFSPRLWRALIKPHLARVFQVGKRRGLPVAYHCSLPDLFR